ERLSRRLSLQQICRSFDLLHVAVAVLSEVKRFATFDVPQAKLARAAGLRPVEFLGGQYAMPLSDCTDFANAIRLIYCAGAVLPTRCRTAWIITKAPPTTKSNGRRPSQRRAPRCRVRTAWAG